jgi:hypothetical protein
LLDLNEDYIVTFPSGFGRSILTVPWVELGGKVSMLYTFFFVIVVSVLRASLLVLIDNLKLSLLYLYVRQKLLRWIILLC